MIGSKWWSVTAMAMTMACTQGDAGTHPFGATVATSASGGGADDPSDASDTDADEDPMESAGSAGDGSTTTADAPGSEGDASTGDAPPGLPPFDPMCDGAMGGGGVPGGNGEPCDGATGCAGGVCYTMGILGGVCGECSSDADCIDGGCTMPDALVTPIAPSFCNDGEQGGGCETDAACCGIGLCGTLYDIPGIATVRTCGQCLRDADCPIGTCQPNLDLPSLRGVLECVLPGSLPLDHSCDPNNASVAACDGVCQAIDVQGLFTLGLCGECSTAADCGAGATCQPAVADFNTGIFTGSRCG